MYASSPTMVSGTSVAATVVNYVYTMAVVASTYSPSVNFAFTVTVSLYGEDTNAFTGTCTTSLTGSNLAGTLSAATSTGTATLSVYFTSVGGFSITASCPASGSSPAVSVVSSAITVLIQKLKISGFTPVVRNM